MDCQESVLSWRRSSHHSKRIFWVSDTNERLDLLALDKQGSLVLIENKLDDTGRDVTWQALKYAAYCSRLSTENVLKIYQEFLDRSDPGSNARERITQFLDEEYEETTINKGTTQRIMLVAAISVKRLRLQYSGY
jgi:hypothetical protein